MTALLPLAVVPDWLPAVVPVVLMAVVTRLMRAHR